MSGTLTTGCLFHKDKHMQQTSGITNIYLTGQIQTGLAIRMYITIPTGGFCQGEQGLQRGRV